MENVKRKKKTILKCFLLLTLVFIWGHSLMSVENSQKESLGFLAFVKPFLELFLGQGNVTDHLVRKLAHFTEFTVLGMEWFLLWGEHWKKKINACFCGLFCALMDETIQIFSGRGSLVKDVWLDFGGVCFGCLLVLLIQKRKNCKNSNE